MFEEDKLNVPPDCKLSEDNEHSLPYFLLGDVIFPLKKCLMRSYPVKNASEEERIYNYQHSRVRRCIENALGILTARWRIFHKPVRATVENVENYTLACLALYNCLRLTGNTPWFCQFWGQRCKFSFWRIKTAKRKWLKQQCSSWFTTCSRFSITSWCSWNKKWIKRLPKQWRRKFTLATSVYSTYILLFSLICCWIQFMRSLFINTLRRWVFTEIDFSQINVCVS